jgi:hypothetical protein
MIEEGAKVVIVESRELGVVESKAGENDYRIRKEDGSVVLVHGDEIVRFLRD